MNRVRPFCVVHRGSGAERMTPALLALLTEVANESPYSLSIHVRFFVRTVRGEDCTKEDVARYFTPRQQRLLRRETQEMKRWVAAFDKQHGLDDVEGGTLTIQRKTTR